jgi:hypothetical protein
MGKTYLRPGPWKIVYTGSSTANIKIDNDPFEIPPGNSAAQTVEFDCQISTMIADDSNMAIYRNPVAPVVSTTQTGGVSPSSAFGVKTKSKLEAL